PDPPPAISATLPPANSGSEALTRGAVPRLPASPTRGSGLPNRKPGDEARSADTPGPQDCCNATNPRMRVA
ncbi:MAG: hypothetical protein K2M88_06760, partial [Muribaculaceae bacterium]|nr:hypothetical protein [Muribaculaceae bacterium]